ncbi:MAG: hypoxanthine phosphoribosyltransferase [Bacteroidia bacterium]|nr:hypoxanthine phosphoribosyltransferase [Bacteroidia bacterium]
MNNTIRILEKEFVTFISYIEIEKVVDRLACQLNNDFRNDEVLFIGILNGSFMFIADLFKRLNIKCRITFLKLASYLGTESTGKVQTLIGINEDIRGKIVVVIEDIVDSGVTLEKIIEQLVPYEPAMIKIVTLLLKPGAYKKKIKLDYVGMEIPDNFIVGYGLDYDGFGRNYEDIYVVKQ